MKQEFEKAEVEVIRFEEKNGILTDIVSVSGTGEGMIDEGDVD